MAEVHLNEFLRLVASRPHRWGSTDCVMTLFEWVRRTSGVDPVAICGADWRSEREARTVIAAVGGILDGGAELFRRCGLAVTDAPARGDIGVIEHIHDGQQLHVAAICCGPRWAFPAEPKGIAMVRAVPLIAWKIGAP